MSRTVVPSYHRVIVSSCRRVVMSSCRRVASRPSTASHHLHTPACLRLLDRTTASTEPPLRSSCPPDHTTHQTTHQTTHPITILTPLHHTTPPHHTTPSNPTLSLLMSHVACRMSPSACRLSPVACRRFAVSPVLTAWSRVQLLMHCCFTGPRCVAGGVGASLLVTFSRVSLSLRGAVRPLLVHLVALLRYCCFELPV